MPGASRRVAAASRVSYGEALKILRHGLQDGICLNVNVPNLPSAQIAGVSYKTIGDAGLEWIQDLDGKVKIPAVLNPMGMDREAFVEMGIDELFAKKQEEIIKAYEKLGTWYKEGKLTFKEDVREGGLEAFPDVLKMLYTGENFGKLILKV